MVSAQSLKTVILTGPSASGKSSLAQKLAGAHGAIEIVNADSLLVYRTMNIGTAKPTAFDLRQVPHHLVDIRNPDQPFTAADFAEAARRAIQEIQSRGKRALLVGGSGFYLKALLYGVWEAPKSDPRLRQELDLIASSKLYDELFAVDPQAALRIGVNDRYRLVRSIEIYRLSGKTPTELEASSSQVPDPLLPLWVIDRDAEELTRRISVRTQAMLDDGLVEEVRELRVQYPATRALGAVGYRQVCEYLEQKSPQGRKVTPGLGGLRSEIELATRQLVKSQRTWFRGEPTARTFLLDRDLDLLRSEFNLIYGPL